MEQRRCQYIAADATQEKSQVVVLAYHNQFRWQYERDYDGSLISQGKLSTINSIVSSQIGVVNGIYGSRFGPIDNITWDDFVKCRSELNPMRDSDGKVMLDSDGNIIGDYMNRDTIAQLGYKFAPKNYPDFRPFKDTALMKRAIEYIPPSMDVKYPPELIVVFVLLIGLVLLTILVSIVMSRAGRGNYRNDYIDNAYVDNDYNQ